MSVWMWAEGVQWILLRNPIYIYGEDYQALHSLMGNNFRYSTPTVRTHGVRFRDSVCCRVVH